MLAIRCALQRRQRAVRPLLVDQVKQPIRQRLDQRLIETPGRERRLNNTRKRQTLESIQTRTHRKTHQHKKRHLRRVTRTSSAKRSAAAASVGALNISAALCSSDTFSTDMAAFKMLPTRYQIKSPKRNLRSNQRRTRHSDRGDRATPKARTDQATRRPADVPAGRQTRNTDTSAAPAPSR